MSDAPQLLIEGPSRAHWTIALAHGAGAPMDTPFMNAFAAGFVAAGMRVARFEFPYMHAQRTTGRRRGPDRAAVLESTWLAVVEQLRSKRHGTGRLVLGGKSMGGRYATLVAQGVQPAGVVVLGYPFHPSGKPDSLRVDHLPELSVPTLICQGTRDPLGNREEVAGYELGECVRIHWLEDGNHDLVPRKRSGRTVEENWAGALDAAVTFVEGLAERCEPTKEGVTWCPKNTATTTRTPGGR